MIRSWNESELTDANLLKRAGLPMEKLRFRMGRDILYSQWCTCSCTLSSLTSIREMDGVRPVS